ncbi:MAG: hypothetical protein IMY72_07375 [Bacteroidetes bacterium]|nr:hypothetical protein [Bacteroidota bacterium]
MKYTKIKHLLSLLSLLFIINVSLAQNTVWMLNGKKTIINDYNINKYEDTHNLIYQNSRGKDKQIGVDEIFSVTDNTGEEKIFYKKDSLIGRFFTTKQMKDYVRGEFEAHKNYKAPLSTALGFIAGGASVIIPLEKMFYAPLIPAVATTIIGCTKPAEKKIKNKYPNYENNNYYILGYKESAKKKRINNALKGSVAGMAAGIIVAFIIGN